MDTNMPPVLASAAEYITFFIVLHIMCTGELFVVLLCLDGLLMIMYQAAALERALGRTK